MRERGVAVLSMRAPPRPPTADAAPHTPCRRHHARPPGQDRRPGPGVRPGERVRGAGRVLRRGRDRPGRRGHNDSSRARRLRVARHPVQQRWHPARVPRRRLPARQGVGPKGGWGQQGGESTFCNTLGVRANHPLAPPPPPLSVEGRHRRLPERPLLRHPGRDSGDAGAGVGPHHQHGEHARTGGVPVQERVQRG